jgi:hypothetical protein
MANTVIYITASAVDNGASLGSWAVLNNRKWAWRKEIEQVAENTWMVQLDVLECVYLRNRTWRQMYPHSRKVLTYSSV